MSIKSMTPQKGSLAIQLWTVCFGALISLVLIIGGGYFVFSEKFALTTIGFRGFAFSSTSIGVVFVILGGVLFAYVVFRLKSVVNEDSLGGAGGNAVVVGDGEAQGGMGGSSGSFGVGGKGGSAHVIGSGKAIGGNGGRSGALGYGLAGDGMSVKQLDAGTSIGGDGGDGARPARPALGARSTLYKVDDPFWQLAVVNMVNMYGIPQPGKGGDSYAASIWHEGREYSLNILLQLLQGPIPKIVNTVEVIDAVDEHGKLIGVKTAQQWWDLAVEKYPNETSKVMAHMRTCEEK